MLYKNRNPKMVEILQINHFGVIEEECLCKVCGKTWKPGLQDDWQCPRGCKIENLKE